MNNSEKRKYSTIEPFFDMIINAVKKLIFALLKAVLSPVIDVLKKLAKIVVDFIANKVLKPIFRPIGAALTILVWPLKPLFAFIGKILEFIVTIIRFIASIIDMIISLPFRILSGMGLVTFPDPPNDQYKNIGQLDGVNKVANIVRDVNLTFTESASKVSTVVNKGNLITFLSIVVLSIIFISLYYFYEEFNSILDEIVKFIKNTLYPKVEAKE
jgi:hypothetical protein